MKSLLRWFSKSLFLFNFGAAFILGLSYLAPVVSPNKVWWIALFGFIYPYMLGINLLFMFYYIFRKKWKFLLSLAILLPYTNRHLNLYQLSSGQSEEKQTFKVLSYNVRLLNKYGWKPNTNTANDILNFIEQEDADILLFQEFYHIDDKPQFRYIDHIVKKTTADNYFFEFLKPTQENRFFGLVIFSKFPIVDKGVVYADESQANKARAIYVDLNIDGETVRVYNLHLASIRLMNSDHDFLQDPNQGNNEAKVAKSKEIVRKLKVAFEKRAQESDIIFAHVKNSPHPVILGGDFNDPAYSYAYYRFYPYLNDAFKEKGKGFGFTYEGSGFLPPYRIDYLMHSNDFEVESFQTYNDLELSDHYPVAMQLSRVTEK
ncbi:MAG: hypothetical protein CL843_13830 [Crocinitomicaceae bacterium]|nr:hypothetical protein [Crocinitomicaceae bacterium]